MNELCATCGEHHAKCKAHSKRTGKKCDRDPRPGGIVCSLHGGNSPLAVAGAERRVAEEKARVAFGKLSDHAEPVDDPFAAFAEIAGHALAWERFCAGKIEELTELRFEDAKGAEQIRGDIVLFERAMDRCAAFLQSYAKLGIEERLSRLEVEQRDRVVSAIEAVLNHLGVTRAQRPEVDTILARELA